jgi:hypothetical protein
METEKPLTDMPLAAAASSQAAIAAQASVASDEDIPPPVARKKIAAKTKAAKPALVDAHTTALQASDIAQLTAPSRSAIATQVALASNEDAPPPLSQRKSAIKEVLIHEEAHNQKANRELRSTYANKAYYLAASCILFWAVAISANALYYGISGKLVISDNALIAITTGVTINVLAAFLGVIRGLFPSDTPKKKERRKQRKV